VSEEPSTDSPGIAASSDDINPASQAPQTETAQAEEPPPPKPRPRWLARLPRASLRIRVIAVVAAAAVIAAIVFAVMPSSPPPKPAYTSLPAPCGTVSLEALAKYLPSPTGTPVSVASPGTVKTDSCKWSTVARGEDRTLWLDLSVFGAPSAINNAQQSYDSTLSSVECHCKGVTVSTRRVTGLGDQATAMLATAGLDAGISSPHTGADLIVQSSNSEMVLRYRYAPDATASPVTATGNPLNPPGTQTSACAWASGNGPILLNLTVYRDALSAGEGFGNDALAFGQSDPVTTVTGTRWLDDLGEQAVAIFQTSSSLGSGLDMLVWSGNIELDYSINLANVSMSASTMLAAGTAMARDGLAILAGPTA
jgi:hypothetical protein